MFDRVYLQSHNVFLEPLDVGALAEAALFYENTELVMARGTLRQLLGAYGADQVMEFVSQGYVNPHYSHFSPMIYAENAGTPDQRHKPLEIGVEQAESDIVHIFREMTGRSGYGRRKANAFIEAVNFFDTGADWQDNMNANFANSDLMRNAILATARHVLGPNDGGEVTVTDLEWSGEHLRVALGGGWQQLQATYEARRGHALSVGALLAPVVSSLTDLQIASRFGADISTGHLGHELLRLKCHELEQGTAGRLSGLTAFEHSVLKGRDIRSAVNSGQRGLDDLMRLLDRAERFRTWVHGQPVDADLVQAYVAEVTAETWASSVPVKAIRFAVTTFAGAALGTAIAGPAGVGLGIITGAADQFVVDRLLQGWRPNQFIEDELDPFVQP